MTTYSPTYAAFTRAEAEQIAGPRRGPHLAWLAPDPDARLSLQDALALMLRNEAAANGLGRLSEVLVRSCVPSILWYALWEGVAVRGTDGREPAKDLPGDDYADMVDRVAGVARSDVRRFVLVAGERPAEAVSELIFHGEYDFGCNPPTETGARFVDLAGVAFQFVTRAGRPLAFLRRVSQVI